jgi:hypothetical protein
VDQHKLLGDIFRTLKFKEVGTEDINLGSIKMQMSIKAVEMKRKDIEKNRKVKP